MVDLTLASSYVPAFVFVAKSLLCSGLCLYFLPMGGLAALSVLLIIDRVSFNSEFIVDINASVAAVFGFAVVNFERYRKGCACTQSALALSALWVALGFTQTARPGTLKSRHELYGYALLAAALSLTSHTQEPVTHLVLRTIAYNLAVLVQVYWQLATSSEEPLVIILLRHGPVLTSPTPVAALAGVVPNVIAAVNWKPNFPPREDTDVEAAALREALASRKEKAGH